MHVVETEPYLPSQVCFAPDHSIWMFGGMRPVGDAPVPDFMTFRHYGRDGKLLGSFVPRSELPAWEGDGSDGLLDPFVGLWSLRTSKDRIGARLNVGPHKHMWLELDLKGTLTGQWTYAVGPQESILPTPSIQKTRFMAGVR